MLGTASPAIRHSDTLHTYTLCVMHISLSWLISSPLPGMLVHSLFLLAKSCSNSLLSPPERISHLPPFLVTDSLLCYTVLGRMNILSLEFGFAF